MRLNSGERDSEPLPDLRSGVRFLCTVILEIKTTSSKSYSLFLWRRERDSNPRVLAHKLISSQPRYDHFDISPCMIKLKMSLIFVVYFAGRPVMSRCGARNFLLACTSQNFDRCHSVCFASSATGSARKRPHFDISPNIKICRNTLDPNIISYFFLKINTYFKKIKNFLLCIGENFKYIFIRYLIVIYSQCNLKISIENWLGI